MHRPVSAPLLAYGLPLGSRPRTPQTRPRTPHALPVRNLMLMSIHPAASGPKRTHTLHAAGEKRAARFRAPSEQWVRPASPHSYEESTSPSYDDAEHRHPTSSAASSVLIAPLEVLLDPFEDPLVFRRWPVPVGTNGGTSVFPLPTTAGIIKRQHAHLDARLAYYKKTDEESNGWQTIPQPQSPSKIWPKVPPFPPPPRRSALPLVEGEQEPQSIPLKSTNRPTSGCESSRPSSSGRRSLLERTLASDPVAAETTPADDVATPAMESLRQALVAQLQRVMDLFRKLDANGDGKVSVQEFQAPPRPACKGSPRRLVPSPQVSAQEFQAVLGLIAPRTTAEQPVPAAPAAPAAPDDGAQQGTVAALGGDVGVASEGGEGAPAAFGAADVEALFHLLDRDSSGTIDYRELHTMLRQGLRVSLDAKLRVGAAGEIALEAKNRIALRSEPTQPKSPEASKSAPPLPYGPGFSPARPPSASITLESGVTSPAILVDLAPSAALDLAPSTASRPSTASWLPTASRPSTASRPPQPGGPPYSQLPSRPPSGGFLSAPRTSASLASSRRYDPNAQRPSLPRPASFHMPGPRAGSPPRSTQRSPPRVVVSPTRSAEYATSPARGLPLSSGGSGWRHSPRGSEPDLSVQIDRLTFIQATRPQPIPPTEHKAWFNHTITWSASRDVMSAERGGAHGAGTGLFADVSLDDLGVVPLRRDAREAQRTKLLNMTAVNTPGPALIAASAAMLSGRDGAGGAEASPGSSRRGTRRVVATRSREIGRFQNRVKVPSDYVPLAGSEPIL